MSSILGTPAPPLQKKSHCDLEVGKSGKLLMACALINSSGSEVERFELCFKRGTDRMC